MLTSFATTKSHPGYAILTIAAVVAIAIDSQAGRAAEPIAASQLNPARHLDLSRSDLQALYPELPSRDLDLLTFRAADIASMLRLSEEPVGDWFCTTDKAGAFRLSMRATSYSLAGNGPTMSGEYTSANNWVTVVSGPLKGMGLVRGSLNSVTGTRVLGFDSGESDLTCKEVL